MVLCFLIKRKWMGNIVLVFSSCSLYALRHRLLHVAEWFEDNDKKGLK